jgi:hypothetical protein
VGNVIAETAGGGATGTTGTTREYIYLYETEIAPTMSSRTVVDRPLAVISAVNTATPATYWVSVDHLNRPVKMTSSTKASVWDAIWQPWGGVHSVSGTATLDARFPGQWFQTGEAGHLAGWMDPSRPRRTACITTGTAATIQHLAATSSPTRSGLWMGRACTGMQVAARIGSWIRMGDLRRSLLTALQIHLFVVRQRPRPQKSSSICAWQNLNQKLRTKLRRQSHKPAAHADARLAQKKKTPAARRAEQVAPVMRQDTMLAILRKKRLEFQIGIMTVEFALTQEAMYSVSKAVHLSQ